VLEQQRMSMAAATYSMFEEQAEAIDRKASEAQAFQARILKEQTRV